MENRFKKALPTVGLGIVIAGAIVSLLLLASTGISLRGIIWALFWPAVFVVQFALVTTPWRAVPLKKVLQMFLIGMSAVPVLALVIQFVLYNIVNIDVIKNFLTQDSLLGNYDLMAIFVAPVTEEILKVLPVIILLAWGSYAAWRRILGPLDVALLGAASGAGFGFVENLYRVAGADWASLGPDRVIPVASPAIGPFYLFPDMEGSKMYGVPTIWFGHAETAAFVGLFLGFGLFIRKKTRLWFLLPAFALSWATWDHFLVNFIDPSTVSMEGLHWANILPPLDLYGGLLPYVFLIGVIIAVGLAMRTVQWYVSKDKWMSVTSVLKDFMAYARDAKNDSRAMISKLWRLRHFLIMRRMLAYGYRDFLLYPKNKSDKWLLWLVYIRLQALDIDDAALKEILGLAPPTTSVAS